MPPKSSPPSDSQQLGAREQSVFKQLVRFYETKQYKKALKAADIILKKQASHGETLAMKGLVYNQLKRRDDAHSLVKRGLEANFNSHVCWHVYGLIYRSENKYEQAIKCFDERTQLLTHDGRAFTWMGVDDLLLAHCHKPKQLLIASYNPGSSQIEYQPMSHPPLIKYGEHSMVELKHAAADCNNEVELSVTDEHTLFVRLDCGSSDASDSSSSVGAVRGGSSRQYSRLEARHLMAAQLSGQVELLSAASEGVNLGNLLRPRAVSQSTLHGQCRHTTLHCTALHCTALLVVAHSLLLSCHSLTPRARLASLCPLVCSRSTLVRLSVCCHFVRLTQPPLHHLVVALCVARSMFCCSLSWDCSI